MVLHPRGSKKNFDKSFPMFHPSRMFRVAHKISPVWRSFVNLASVKVNLKSSINNHFGVKAAIFHLTRHVRQWNRRESRSQRSHVKKSTCYRGAGKHLKR